MALFLVVEFNEARRRGQKLKLADYLILKNKNEQIFTLNTVFADKTTPQSFMQIPTFFGTTKD